MTVSVGGLGYDRSFENKLSRAAESVIEESFGRICGDCAHRISSGCDQTFDPLTTSVVNYDAVACSKWKMKRIMSTRSVELCSIAAHASWYSLDHTCRSTWDLIKDKQKLEMRRVVKLVMSYTSKDKEPERDVEDIVELVTVEDHVKRSPSYLSTPVDAHFVVAAVVSVLRSLS